MALVNAQIKDAVATTAAATISAKVTKDFGQGVAFQSVAITAGLVVSDAADMVRNVSMICTAATAVMTLKMVEKKDPTYIPLIAAMQETIQQSGVTFQKVGMDAAAVMKEFVPT